MPVRTDQHQIRSVFDKAFLKMLSDEHEIVFDETSGKVHGLEACVRRLYEWRKDRMKKDMSVLFPSSTPRPQDRPRIIAPSTAGDVLGEGG